MKNTVATNQKLTATRAVKTSDTVRLRSGLLPVYRVSAKTYIDPSEFIPIADGKKPARDGIKLLRRADLFPKKAVLYGAPGHFNFGDTLLDEFSSTYGTFYPIGKPYFLFNYSILFNTGEKIWFMELNKEKYGYEPELQFQIIPPTPANYVKIPLYQTTDIYSDRCILTVNINNTEFNLDLSHRSYQYFDLYLTGDSSAGYDVVFSLRFAPNNQKRAICAMRTVELYDTIRAFPVEAFEA